MVTVGTLRIKKNVPGSRKELFQCWTVKLCRRSKVQNSTSTERPNKQINNVETEETTPSKDNKVNEIHEYYNPDCDLNHFSADTNCVATICSNSKMIEPINQKVTIGTIETMIMVDSVTVSTIINESLARPEVGAVYFSLFIRGANARELPTYSNTTIPIVGKVQFSITINNQTANPVDIIVVRDGLRPLLGSDVFSQL